jgi:isochorismate hydrolase
VKATGKKQLIIAGTITSVCMAFPSIAAVHDGYQVFAVVDASGTYSAVMLRSSGSMSGMRRLRPLPRAPKLI